MRKGAAGPFFYPDNLCDLLPVRNLLLAGDYHGMGLVLGAFDGMDIAEQTLQDVFLAPAGLDGKALVFASLVKCGHPVAGCRFVGDGIDHQITVGDIEGAGFSAILGVIGIGMSIYMLTMLRRRVSTQKPPKKVVTTIE